jgi:hypothetical protein
MSDYLTASSLGDIPHGFSSSAGLGADQVLPGAALVRVRQVHSATVLTACDAWEEPPEADAIVTNRPALALGIVTADCAPVLLADPEARVIGAAHAGWRGALAGVLGNTVARGYPGGHRADNCAGQLRGRRRVSGPFHARRCPLLHARPRWTLAVRPAGLCGPTLARGRRHPDRRRATGYLHAARAVSFLSPRRAPGRGNCRPPAQHHRAWPIEPIAGAGPERASVARDCIKLAKMAVGNPPQSG